MHAHVAIYLNPIYAQLGHAYRPSCDILMTLPCKHISTISSSELTVDGATKSLLFHIKQITLK